MARTRGSSRVFSAGSDPSLPPPIELHLPDDGQEMDWKGLFDSGSPVEADIGCGKGRFILARAHANPETRFLGVDREGARIARLDLSARRANVSNLRALRADAMPLLCDILPDASLTAVYFFFPDPWPKRRHHRRRLFSPVFQDAIFRVLKPGGGIHVATDQESYYETMRASLEQDARFTQTETLLRTPEEYTDFELIFRGKGCPVYAASYERHR